MTNTDKPIKYIIFAKCECPRQILDAGRLNNYFLKNGLERTRKVRNADVIVTFTCGGFRYFEERSVHTVKKILGQKKKSARFFVTGCLPSIHKEALEMGGDFTIWPMAQMDRFDELISAKVPYQKVPAPAILPEVMDLYDQPLKTLKKRFKLSPSFISSCIKYSAEKVFNPTKPGQAIFQDAYNLEIARGCLGNCSYCAIKFAHGKLQSMPEEQVIEEFKQGLSRGYKRFVIIAGDSGCYGVDIGKTFPGLLEKLFAVPGDYKIIINDVNAQWIVKYHKELLSIFKRYQDKIEDVRVPIQSGSNRILQLMKRPYKIEDVKANLLDIKKNIPTLKLHTHILVGFPGETTEDFMESIRLVSDVNFERVDVFCYEDRPNTEASAMQGKIPLTEIRRRAKLIS